MDFRDLISNLPNAILGKILSLLPTKVAASTTALSKRWRNLLSLVDTLCFDETMVVYPNEEEAISGSHRFLEFVENTIALLSSSRIKKLSLCHVARRGCDYDYSRIYLRIWTAMESGLLELHLQSNWSGIDLEREFFTSNTLVKLTLSGEYSLEVERVLFPALKTLSLLSVTGLDYDNYQRLLDGCPVLEELFITDADHPYQPCCGAFVKSASIKRLVVFVNLPDSKEYHDVTYFKAPSLVYLDYSSYVSEQYELVGLDSLAEARLSLRLWEPDNYYDCNYNGFPDDEGFGEPKVDIFGDITGVVAAIANVTTLHLSSDSLEAFHFCCKSMPVFSNLLDLSVESNKDKGWQVMPLLLKSCPNLDTFSIKGLVHRVTDRCGDACTCIPKKQNWKIVKEKEEVCCLWTCQVKVLEISEYGGSIPELEQMRHFLGNLKCLETVKVGVGADKNNNSFLQANLLTLPRVSSKCNIQFI